MRRTTRFGGEVGWTPCGSAARLPDAGLRRFTLRSRAAGATALSPTITSTGPPASRGAECGGDARVLFAAAGPGAFPTRARASRAARPRPRDARAAGRHLRGRAPKGDERRGEGARRRGVRRRRRRGARRVFVRRRERSGGAAKPPVAGAAATSPLPWKRIPPWKATRTRRRCFRSRRRRARRRRGRARPASRGSPRTPTRRARAAARPARRAAGGARRDPDADRPEARERQPEPSCSIPEWTSSERPCFPRCAARARRRRRPPRPSQARVCEVARAAWEGPPWARRRGRRARWWSRARARRGWRCASRPRPPPRAQTGETCTARDGSGSSSARSRSGAATRGRLPNVEGPKSVSETAEARFVSVDRSRDFGREREEEIPGPPTAADAFVRGVDGQRGRAGR